MNEYQKEQYDALTQIDNTLKQMDLADTVRLKASISSYLQFRQDIDRFLELHFSNHCTQRCFQKSISACCSKDGIIVFWADLVVNACQSTSDQMDALFQTIIEPFKDNKCIYLGPSGCCWQVRPLVCAMFLCDTARHNVFAADPEAGRQWLGMEETAKKFRWPDRPVLFDHIEQLFIAAGCHSSLMFLNNSPGLLRIKQHAGLTT